MNHAVKKFLSEIGKKGGSVTSKAKAEAARKNGKKGGRPKKEGKQ
jgi:general stress protein YciG